MLEGCFERCLPPSEALACWLLHHPSDLHWPLTKGEERTFGQSTQESRSMLTGDNAEAASKAQHSALQQLRDFGVIRSEGKWWMFEGQTEADCCLETDDLVLVIEGKRNESLSQKTDWMPQRNQLWRNVEAASVWARGRRYAVMVIGERHEEPSAASLDASLPHLSPEQRRFLADHYLGCTTWRDVCNALKIDYDALPNKVTDVISEPPCEKTRS